MSIPRSILFFFALFYAYAAAIAQTQTPVGEWPKASAAESGLSETKLQSLETAIHSGQFNTRGMHEQTDKILTDYVLASVEK